MDSRLRIAADGEGRNRVYTNHLLVAIMTPGLALALDGRYLLDAGRNQKRQIHGRVDELFVVLDKRRSISEQSALLHRFQDYAHDSWDTLEGKDIRVYANSYCIH